VHWSVPQLPREAFEVFGGGAKHGLDSSEELLTHSTMGYRDKTTSRHYPL